MRLAIEKKSDATDPLAESRLLMSFLTFHIWIFCSAASGWLMAVADSVLSDQEEQVVIG